MAKKLPTSVYRTLFVDAWRLTIERKALWVFGLFAAVLSTGGVCEMAAKGFRNLVVIRDVYLDILRGTFTGAEVFGQLVKQLTAFDPNRLTGAATLVIFIGIVIVIASIVSQGALIAGCGPKPISDRNAYLHGNHTFWHLLPLNVLHKIVHVLLTLLAAIPLLILVQTGGANGIFVSLITFLIILPLTIIVATLFMLASIHSVRTGNHTLDSIHHAVNLFRSHTLATFETGAILFAAVLVAIFGFLATLMVFSLPFAVLATVALVSESVFFFTILNILGVIALFFLLAVFAGATTTFQYAVWVKFYDHAISPRKKIISKLHRVWIGK